MRNVRARVIASIAPAYFALAVLGGAVAFASTVMRAEPGSGPVGDHAIPQPWMPGYGAVKGCAQCPGVAGMGVKGDLVGDPHLDRLRPEGAGQWLRERAVATSSWRSSTSSSRMPGTRRSASSKRKPSGRLTLIPAPNAYELPDFYEIHLWLGKKNPKGLFADSNPPAPPRICA